MVVVEVFISIPNFKYLNYNLIYKIESPDILIKVAGDQLKYV